MNVTLLPFHTELCFNVSYNRVGILVVLALNISFTVISLSIASLDICVLLKYILHLIVFVSK